ncbi:hypothetical protein C8J57DRAFT_1458430 [Mycena rebaudengoi]|nr:hypothetical protein C8J57DRAFT_1458430 [Mycena rebaudengoi]
MHHFFSIPDLVELLCEEEGYPYPRVHCKDLAALARTATVFHHPALDVMWRHQYTPMNVILCMPVDLWESEESARNESDFALARPITPSDLECPLLYSKRVKSMSMTPCELTLDLFRILEVMKPFLPQGIFFPNLRQLDLCLKDERGDTILPYLSLAFVTSICLELESRSSLPDLPLYPALKRLDIFSGSPDPAHLLTSSSTSTCVRKLTQIEELALPTLDRAAYDHLSTLPTLRSLSLTERARDPLPFIPPGGTHVFPSASTSLDTIYDTCIHNGGGEWVLEHSVAVSKAKVGPDFDGRTLSHLLCFSKLREVDISVRGAFLLDDAAVWDMARAWPNLVKLKLTDDSSSPPITMLASLRAFATHCPELITLALTFDATVVPPSSDEQPVLHNKLSGLYVWSSPISSPTLVGRFLAGIFPNIERTESFGRSRLWKEVEAVVG